MSGALTPRQEAFRREYLVDLNGTQAAIRAGYSAKTAESQANRLLKNAKIAAAIQRGMNVRALRTDITADRVLTEIARMAFYDAADFGSAVDQNGDPVRINGPADIAKLPEDVRRAIIGWSWDKAGNFTLKLADKGANLERLGRHLKLFTDKVEHAGPNGAPIAFDLTHLTRDQILALEAIKVVGERED